MQLSEPLIQIRLGSKFIFSHSGWLSQSNVAISEKLYCFIIAAYMLVLNNIFHKQDCFD